MVARESIRFLPRSGQVRQGIRPKPRQSAHGYLVPPIFWYPFLQDWVGQPLIPLPEQSPQAASFEAGFLAT
jgi:hypothetical protein